MTLSIVVPIYNEEGNIYNLYNNIKKNLKGIKYEIIFINDGSIDGTMNVLEKIYQSDKKKNIKIINFSRNFGKDSAMYAGLFYSSYYYTAIIDADMQQNPIYLVDMINFLEKNSNYDQVAMIAKRNKGDYLFKRVGGNIFYKLINRLSYVKFESNVSDFRMFRKNVKEAILSLKETNRFSKGIYNWVGFNTKYMEYEVDNRFSGKTKFNLKASINYAINGIIDYSDKLLNYAFIIGGILFIFSFISLLYFVIMSFLSNGLSNKFEIIVSLILFIGGIELIFIGIIGFYLSKNYVETKRRPIYIIKSTRGFGDD